MFVTEVWKLCVALAHSCIAYGGHCRIGVLSVVIVTVVLELYVALTQSCVVYGDHYLSYVVTVLLSWYMVLSGLRVQTGLCCVVITWWLLCLITTQQCVHSTSILRISNATHKYHSMYPRQGSRHTYCSPSPIVSFFIVLIFPT